MTAGIEGELTVVDEQDVEYRSVLGSVAPAMAPVRDAIESASRSSLPLTLCGEWGSGKRAVARLVHGQSTRRTGPFVELSPLGISSAAYVSALCGYAREDGTRQPGAVQAAGGGTLLLHEINSVPAAAYDAVARLASAEALASCGSARIVTTAIDASLVDALPTALGRAVVQLVVVVPPLRERPEDILELARGYLAFYGRLWNRPARSLDVPVQHALLAHPWCGNLPELRYAMQRAVLVARDSTVRTGDVQLVDRGPQLTRFSLDDLQRALLLKASYEAHGQLGTIARRVGMSRGEAYRALKRHALIETLFATSTK